MKFELFVYTTLSHKFHSIIKRHLFQSISTVSTIKSQLYRKIHYLTREFHVKFHAKNRYRTNREAMSAVSVFQVKFKVEYASQVIDFP